MAIQSHLLKIATPLLLAGLVAAGASAQEGSPLSSTLEAHGGLETWRAQRTFTYTLRGFPLSPQVAEPNTATADLHRRLHRIEGSGFVAGYDGENAWAVPGDEAIGLPARFYTLGSFYFVAMPHVFADPGVIVEPGESQVFDGKSHDTLSVRFADGVGHTAEDEYVLLIDPQTHLLRAIHHSVTENPDVDRVTWAFDEWTEVSGLLVPARMTFHAGWNPDDPGEGASFTIEDITLSPDIPDPTQFKAPGIRTGG